MKAQKPLTEGSESRCAAAANATETAFLTGTSSLLRTCTEFAGFKAWQAGRDHTPKSVYLEADPKALADHPSQRIIAGDLLHRAWSPALFALLADLTRATAACPLSRRHGVPTGTNDLFRALAM